MTKPPTDPAAQPRGAPSFPDGLQAERTALAWSRTALGAAANAALLAVNEFKAVGGGVAAWLAVAFAVAIALAMVLIGEQRKRTLNRDPRPRLLPPTVALPVGGAITTLGLVTGAIIII
jgi:hypothetical protein